VLGCFNPNLGQIWTNPNVGLKMSTQLQLSLSTVIFLITFLTHHFEFVHILPQIWVETTQHFLEFNKTVNINIKINKAIHLLLKEKS